MGSGFFVRLLFVPLFLQCCLAIDNGLGRTPQMGYNSWYDVQMNPTEQVVRETVAAIHSTGLYAAGYRYLNLDDGMVALDRDSHGRLQPDPQGFPSGFNALSDFIHSKGMLFGVYTDRGTKTCGGRPAALGHETVDAQTYATWGVDYVKEDSCNASQDHQTAYKEYSLMRDALNATGRSIFFSLCGWNPWYAPVGHSLGNSWRTGPDDSTWSGVLTNLDMIAPLWPFAGPGGWNDPCLLLGRDSRGSPRVTDQQGRAQFTMWAIVSAPLLLSQNVRNLTAFQLQTYLNKEVIAINQDPLGRAGQKLQGGNLANGNGVNPPLTLQTCVPGQSTQQWKWNVSYPFFLSNVGTGLCANVDNCGTDLIGYHCVTSGGTCAGPNSYSNEQFRLSSATAHLTSSLNSLCVTSSGLGYPATLSPCSSTNLNQHWTYNPSTLTLQSPNGCLTMGGPAADRSNVWGKPLYDGSWAIAFINVGSGAVDLTCDAQCFAATEWGASQVVKVRDVWKGVDIGQMKVGDGLKVMGLEENGGIALFRLTPVW